MTKRSFVGECPYPSDLLPSLDDILERAAKFSGDLQAVIRVVYLCNSEEALDRYKDFVLIREPTVQKHLKPLLIEAYRKYTPTCARGAFLEAIFYRQIRRLHSGRFEISRWVLYGDVSPVCPSCAAKSVDVLESDDGLEVAVECKVSLESWLKHLDPADDHLTCLNELRHRHKEQSLRVAFVTLDPIQKKERVSRLLSSHSFTPDHVLYRDDSPDW